jgi:hypothetical protein
MKSSSPSWRFVGITSGLVAAALFAAWWLGILPQSGGSAPANAMMVVAPYRHAGAWAFDNPGTGLVRKPFVSGVPEMIDVLVRDIPGVTNGFRLLFSAQPLPRFQKKLSWRRGDMGGNYYRMDEPVMEGWICPALFRYYQTAPKEIYVKAEAKR